MCDEKMPGASQDDSTPGLPNQPRYGEYAPPGWTPPKPQHWAPAPSMPKPGLLPLRPLFLGDVIVGAFRVIRRNPKPTFWFALIFSFVASLVAVALVGLVLWNTLAPIDLSTPPDPDTVRAIVIAVVLTAFVAAIIQLVLTVIPQAIVTLEVARGTLGERLTLRELWGRARGRVGALIGWTLILGGGAAFILVLTVLGLAEIALTGGLSGAVAAVGFGILIGLALLAVSAWLGAKLAFVPALIIIERRPIGAALRRSWAMTHGSFWRILGITLLVNLILQVAAQIVTMPITLTSSFVNQTQAIGSLDTRVIVVVIVSLIVQIFVTALVIVVQSAVPAILYLDIRMRREHFDVVLREHAERGANAGTSPSDPFTPAEPGIHGGS